MDVPELVERSEVVVQGVTGDVVATGQASLPGTDLVIPYSDVAIEVTDVLRGTYETPNVIHVRTLGGPSLMVTEEPTFAFGEEVVVFACKDTGNLYELPWDTFTVQGLFQGKYTVVRGAPTPLAVRAEEEPIELQTLIDQIGHAGGAAAGPTQVYT